jgi:hypothetical protein
VACARSAQVAIDRRQLVADGHLDAFGGRRRVVEQVGPIEQPGAVLVIGPGGGVANQQGAFEELDRNVLAGSRLELQIPLPGEETIDPGDDFVLVPPDGIDDKARDPQVGPGRGEGHRRLAPLSTSYRRVAEIAETMFCSAVSACSAVERDRSRSDGRDDIVPVREDGRAHLDRPRRACA